MTCTRPRRGGRDAAWNHRVAGGLDEKRPSQAQRRLDSQRYPEVKTKNGEVGRPVEQPERWDRWNCTSRLLEKLGQATRAVQECGFRVRCFVGRTSPDSSCSDHVDGPNAAPSCLPSHSPSASLSALSSAVSVDLTLGWRRSSRLRYARGGAVLGPRRPRLED